MVASGARYRRPEIENLDAFEGRGVWYWASPIEAKLCAGQDVVLVGGGSGHGFKHGPEVGRLAAALVSGTAPQPQPRFTLATKANTQKREVH